MATASKKPQHQRTTYQTIWFSSYDGQPKEACYECVACHHTIALDTWDVGAFVRCSNCGVRGTVVDREPLKTTMGARANLAVKLGGERLPVDAAAVYTALKVRHPEPEWVYLPQVRTMTGYSETPGRGLDSVRSLDAFAMSCYRSGGFERVGYEIKVSRTDWRNELEDPRKRAQGYLLTHRFYYALAPGVYHPGDEVDVTIRGKSWHRPLDGCGIVQVEEDGTITMIREALHRDAFPMPPTFVASLLRQYMSAVVMAAHLEQQLTPATYRTPEEDAQEANGHAPEQPTLLAGLWADA